jgi:predicted short-subunit dehydrogenase-like oxidoreductase (DUF2520 family)
MAKINFTLVGPGAVGKSLALGMKASGYRLLSVVGQDTNSDKRFAHRMGVNWSDELSQLPPETGLILVAVPDSQLKLVATALSRQKLPWKKIAVLHTAGAIGAEVFAKLERLGAAVGACHPFMTFPARGRHSSPQISKRPPRLPSPHIIPPRHPSPGARNFFEGVTFGIDGNEAGLKAARKLAQSLGGIPLEISGQQRVLYHLAAVLSCGMVAANLLMAQRVLYSLGLSETRALETILPISTETLSNIKELGIRDAMTGPAVRGDTATIRRHLAALKKLDPEMAKVYNEMSKWVLGKEK